jgi:hypothetical protein
MSRIETAPPESRPLKDQLLHRIESHAAASGLSDARIATLAVNDGDFVRRLRDGGTCHLETFEKFMAWLDDAERTLNAEVAQ